VDGKQYETQFSGFNSIAPVAPCPTRYGNIRNC
jgi:hypothetical protein